MKLVEYVFILIILLVFFYLNQDMWIEMFSAAYQTFQSYAPINTFKYPMYPLTNSPANWFYNFFPILNGYTNLPWNNMALGTTSNMSYDLRGDSVVIPRTEFVWNNPSTFPIYNPPI